MYVKLFEGKGGIIPFILIVVVGGIDYLWKMLKGDAIAQYGQLVMISSIFLAALALFLAGRTIAVATSRTLLDPATGASVLVKQRHTFLGGSPDTWAYVIGAFAIYALGHALYMGTLFKVG